MLQSGQAAQCLADAFPERPFPATVNYIAPSIDAQRGTVNIRLKVEPVPPFLRQDMTVSVTVETGRRDAALVVPNDALLDAGTAAPAALVVRDGRLRRVPVQLGLRGLALTEVVSGLAAGDWVLASAAGIRRRGRRARARVRRSVAGSGRRQLHAQGNASEFRLTRDVDRIDDRDEVPA